MGQIAADRLGYRCLDGEILARAAEKGQLDSATVADAEQRRSLARRLLDAMGENVGGHVLDVAKTQAHAAVLHGLSGSPLFFQAAAGAIAAATADTWATEAGRWSPTAPRLITTGTPVLHGRSGGVTPLGTVGSAGGALLIAVVATALAGRPLHSPMLIGVLAGGFSGALLDSVLGATIEGRVPWIDNSLINLLATTWGAGVGLAAALWWH